MLIVASKETIDRALAAVNERYQGNIQYRKCEAANRKGTRWNVTLWVKDPKGPGHRLGFPRFTGFDTEPDYSKRRRLPYACWHVHGHFFDAIFEIEPEAKIKSGRSLANPNRGDSGWITKDRGNWEDTNIGTRFVPYYFSEACDC